MVVASAEYAFLGWDIVVEVHSGQRFYLCKRKRAHLTWKRITDLADWKVLPVEPHLISSHQGPIGWQRSGSALRVEVPLPVKHLRGLILALGGHCPNMV